MSQPKAKYKKGQVVLALNDEFKVKSFEYMEHIGEVCYELEPTENTKPRKPLAAPKQLAERLIEAKPKPQKAK